MKHDWIIGVIVDLHRYATRHGLEELSRHLGAAISSAREGPALVAQNHRSADVSREEIAARRMADRSGGGR